MAKNLGFRYWEISNEPYVGDPGKLFFTPDTYASPRRGSRPRHPRVQPTAQIGMSINGPETGEASNWNNYLLKKAAGTYDFVVPHYYFYVRSTARDLKTSC